MLELLWVALAAGGVAVTVTKSRLFEEIREAFTILVERTPWPVFKLAILIRCPYCAAHWLVALAWILYTPRVNWPVIMFFVTTTVATAVAAVISRMYSWSAA